MAGPSVSIKKKHQSLHNQGDDTLPTDEQIYQYNRKLVESQGASGRDSYGATGNEYNDIA